MTNPFYILEIEKRDFMNFVDGIIINLLYVLFPILVYLIFISYKNNVENQEKEQETVLSLVLITSLYLILRFDKIYDLKFCIVLCNLPLLISYLKNLKYTNVILSVGIIFYYYKFYDFNLYMLILEYSLYYVVYRNRKKNQLAYPYLINRFVLIKSFILSFQEFVFIRNYNTFSKSFLYILSLMVSFYIISYFVFYLLDHVEQILNLNRTLKELEREKVLRNSLFKLTHEIKNPIAVCKGYLDMMDTKDSKKIEKYLPILKSEISRTLVIMDDFLDYSKIKINKDIIDINILIEDTLDSLNYLFKKNEIILNQNLDEEEIYIDGDYNRLKQVLINVFKNAIEAKKKKMQISLSSKIKNKNFILEIRDNGIGMDEETLSRVYETFYTTKKTGTGLGVAISKEIIERHGGKMKYTSTLGEGTTVYISLPIYEEV